MPTLVGILTFVSMKNFMLSLVEHEKSFITSGPDVSLDEELMYCTTREDGIIIIVDGTKNKNNLTHKAVRPGA